jgi:hypothetical protein
MGMITSTSKPHGAIAFLAGNAEYSIGYSHLAPTCGDLGMRARLTDYASINDLFRRSRDELHEASRYSFHIGPDDSGMDDAPWLPDWFEMIVPAAYFPCSLPAAICGGAGLTVLLLGLILLMAGICFIIRRKKKEQALVLSVWEEGRLARLFITLYLPALLLSTAVLIVAHTMPRMYGYALYSDMAAPVLTGVAFIISTALLIRALRRRYNEHADRRVGVFRFIFGVPASVHVWKLKQFSIALSAQLLFFACILLLLTALYKPVFGYHPWQSPMRAHITWGHDGEKKCLNSLCERLEKASPWKK